MLRPSPPPAPRLPEDFAPPLSIDPNPDGRDAVMRGLVWGVGGSIILWAAMIFAWHSWGWWGPPGVLAGGSVALAAVALACRRVGS